MACAAVTTPASAPATITGLTAGTTIGGSAPAAGLSSLASLVRELENAANLQTTNVALENKVAALENKVAVLEKLLAENEAHYNADVPRLETALASERTQVALKLQIKILRTELANEKKEKAELAEVVEDIYASIIGPSLKLRK